MTQTLAYQATHRKVYPHSIIAGGVYSAEELSRARRIDPVVAEHYADFGEDIRATQLSHDQLVYVSYRKAEKVYWTKTKHLVCKGEAVVTDGKNIARSRCGNRLSKTPKLPHDKTEPTETALNYGTEPGRGNPGANTGAPGGTNGLDGTGYQPATRPGSDAPGSSGGLPIGDGSPGQTGASGPGGKTGAARNSGFGPPAISYPSYSPVFAIGPLVTRRAGTPVGTGTTTDTPPPIVTPTAATPEPASVVLVLLGGLGVWSLRRRASAH